MNADPWSWMLSSRSKLSRIQPWHFADRAARESVDPAPWTLTEPTPWPVCPTLMMTPKRRSRFTLFLTCTLLKIWFQTWEISTNSIVRFNHGCNPNMKRRKVKENTCKPKRIARNWTACTSVFFVLAVRRHVLPIGGMRTSIWDLLFSCKPIVGLRIHEMDRQRNGWPSWMMPSSCIDAIPLWTVQRYAPSIWILERPLLKSKRGWRIRRNVHSVIHTSTIHGDGWRGGWLVL